jgi:hypothetical protein
MASRRLSLVRDDPETGEAVVCTMREAAHAEVDRICDMDPTVMAFLAQRLDAPMILSSLPGSRCVLEGMVGGAGEALDLPARTVPKED